MATKTRRAYELHVEPAAGGRWVVCYEHSQPAFRAPDRKRGRGGAERRAYAEGITRVLLHDCYTRVHEVAFIAPGRRPSRTQ